MSNVNNYVYERILPHTKRAQEVVEEFKGWVLNCRRDNDIETFYRNLKLEKGFTQLVIDKNEHVYRVSNEKADGKDE